MAALIASSFSESSFFKKKKLIQNNTTLGLRYIGIGIIEIYFVFFVFLFFFFKCGVCSTEKYHITHLHLSLYFEYVIYNLQLMIKIIYTNIFIFMYNY